MRAYYHIERDFAQIPMNFLWLEYHQIRFVSFGIWFLGLFLTDFTSIVSSPVDGWNDVLNYIKVISIIHIIFLLLFLCYIFFRHFHNIGSEAPTWRMVVQAMFDMSFHLDIAALIFVEYFPESNNAIFALEILVLLDAIFTIALTPFKAWRALIDIVGVLPTIILIHVSIYKPIKYLICIIPISIGFLCPLIFTFSALACSNHISTFGFKIINRLDPFLLPNTIPLSRSNDNQSNDQNDHHQTISRPDQPPSINEKATTGAETDYFDFKSIPFFIAATLFIHFGCFADGMHTNTMIVMAHYFLMLAALLINTRVVAFPAIILTNVTDSNVHFNSVWPELSFV